MDEEKHKKIIEIARNLPDEDHKFDLGDSQEQQPDLSNVVEAIVETHPIEGMPNIPQVNTDYVNRMGSNDHVKPVIHPNAIKKLADTNSLISFIGRSVLTTEERRGSVPLSIRCTMDEDDVISKGNFFRTFPFKDCTVSYTVKGNFFVINNYPYVVFRFERDQYKDSLKAKREKKTERHIKRKEYLKRVKEEAKAESKKMEEIEKSYGKEETKKDKKKEEKGDWL